MTFVVVNARGEFFERRAAALSSPFDDDSFDIVAVWTEDWQRAHAFATARAAARFGGAVAVEKGVCGACGRRVPGPSLPEHELVHGWTSGHHYTGRVLDRVRCSPCGLAEFRAEQMRRERAR